jgi:hypothetical protein
MRSPPRTTSERVSHPMRCGSGHPRRGGVVQQAVVEGGRGRVSKRSPVPEPAPNKGLELTAGSVRCAPASGRR